MTCSHIFKHLILASMLSTSALTFAQSQETTSMYSWEDFVEQIADENDDEYSVDAELFEMLEEMHSHPVNINNARKEELMVLPFLSEEKIDDVLRYIERNGEMATLGELMLIRSLSKSDRDMIKLFVYAEEVKNDRNKMPDFGTLMRRSTNNLMWRSDIPFYEKAGFMDYPEEVLEKNPNKVYQGDKFHHSLRYSLSSLNHLFAGVQMEKDAGERGIDYVSGYVMVKDMGILHRAIAGNYRISFGQGLAINTSARYGKMMMLNQPGRMDAGISKHSSTAETGYLTGGAATLKLGNTLVSAFASFQNADGTFRNDSLGITSLKTDGLHRTKLERSKDGNIGIANIGGNVHWDNNALQLSASFVATHLDTPLAPDHSTKSSLYRLYNAQGQDFIVGSIAYSYRFKRITFTGETAMSNASGFYNHDEGTKDGNQSGLASLNTLRWRVNSNNALTVIGRYYGAKFVSLNGKAFSENSSVQNEEGVFVGWTSQSLPNIKLDAYADFMYFPWLKYQVSDSSYGMEGMAQMEYTPRQNLSFLLRYRVKSKERDFNISNGGSKFTTLQYKTNHNLKLQMNYALSNSVTLKTLATGVFTHFGSDDEVGFAFGENIRWQKPSSKAHIDFGITYFSTDSYDSRVYAYEPSLLYAFGFSSYYYKGIRTTLLATLPLKKDTFLITAKLGATHYINKETIGTGLDLIDANHREDLQVQLRWKL